MPASVFRIRKHNKIEKVNKLKIKESRREQPKMKESNRQFDKGNRLDENTKRKRS
jgi:hypothetical protein